MKYSLFLLFCCAYATLQAQNIPQNPNRTDKDGKRQGKWTICYDKDWKALSDCKQAVYYRLIAYQDDKPIGKTKDYYLNGVVLWEGTLIADRPEEVMDGEAIWYDEQGKKSTIRVFDKGKMLSEKNYNPDGTEKQATAKSQMNTEINQALADYNAEKYTEALPIFEKYQKQIEKEGKDYPDNLKVFYSYLATCYQKIGRQKEYEVVLSYIQAIEKFTKQEIEQAFADFQAGKYAEALPIFEKYRKFVEMEFKDKPEDLKNFLTVLATCYQKTGRQDEFDALLPYIRVKENYWKALDLIGMKAYLSGDFTKAIDIFEQAKRQAEKEFGKKNSNYATSCFHLALSYQSQRLYVKAELLLIEAKNIIEQVLGKEHSDYALSCKNLAKIYSEQGLYLKAEPLLIEAKNIIEQVLGKGHSDYAQSCDDLAGLYKSKGLYAKAEPLYIEAKNSYEKVLGKEHPDYATSCNNLAGLYQFQGFYAKAEPFYVEAKNIYEKILGKEHLDYATSCNNLAQLYTSQGLYAKAELLFLEAKEIIAKVKKDNLYAANCNNLAELYQNQGMYAKAAPLYIEAKEIQAKVLGKEHPDYASTCSNLARLYQNQRMYTNAETLYLEAKEIMLKVFGKEHPDYARIYHNLASMYDDQGLFDKSEALLLEAKEIKAKSIGKLHPSYATSCNNLAGLYVRQGLYVKAEPLYKEVSKVLIGQTESNFSNLSEKEKGLFLETFKYNFEIYNSFTLKAYRQSPSLTGWLYDNTLVIKGLLLQSTQKMREAILNSGDEALKKQFTDWQSKKEYLARVATLTIADKQKQGIDEKKLEAEANDLEKQLSLRASNLQGFGNLEGLTGDKTRYTWQDIQKSLKPSEVAIEIIRTRYFDKQWTDSVLYIALIIRPDTKGQPEMVVMGNGKEMEKIYFVNYRDDVGTRGARGDSTQKGGEDLDFDVASVTTRRKIASPYEAYWKPIRDALYKVGKPKKVYLSLDGIYHKVSLLGLQNPETQQYLLEEIEIHQVSNTKDIIKWQQNKATTKTSKPDAVLVGYPTYRLGAEDYKTFLATPAESRGDEIGNRLENAIWTPLPGTEKEVKAITSILHAQKVPVQTYMQAKASEELIKRVRFPRILHIATHGAFFESEEEDRDDFQRLGNQNQKVSFSPMLRSGLALAGITNFYRSQERPNTEDGFLTAFEAANLFLDNTELVVLSACETGLGASQNGEGVFGLQRGFQQAGAKTVLMSLWSVSDEATQELMTLFYTNWLSKKQSKRDAFKNAQNELKKKYPEPYYWAAFVMVGE